MNNIFSKNKYIDIVIKVLLFMMAVNVFHYGQLILPVICLIIFIDNRLKFKVNNPYVFILLCLFAVSFYAFSYKLGFYSVMGFCCPMAYYIGSNLRKNDSESIKEILYIFALGMALHIVMNVFYELSIRGWEKLLNSSAHYDVWTRDKMSSTVTATNLMYLIGCSYYLIFYERSKLIKIISGILFVISMAYCLIIGRRTSVLAFIMIFVLSIIFEKIHNPDNRNINKRFFMFIGAVLLLSAVFIVMFILNKNGVKTIFDNVYIVDKFKQSIFDENRIAIYKNAISLLPNYLWGGQHISNAIGIQIHELWLDVYDYAGIVPYLLLLAYTYFYVRDIYKVYKKDIKVEYKVLFLAVYLIIAVQMFLEPAMTGISLFVMISIIYGTMVGKVSDK